MSYLDDALAILKKENKLGNLDRAINLIKRYQYESPAQWSIEDVKHHIMQNYSHELTDEQAKEILETALDQNSTIGWDDFDYWYNEIYKSEEIVYTAEDGEKYTKPQIMGLIANHLNNYNRPYLVGVVYDNLMSVLEWQHPETVLEEMEAENDYGAPYYQPEND